MARTDPLDWDAFVSYSRQDKAFVQRLTDALRRWRPPRGLNGGRPLRVFLDLNDIGAGDCQREIEAQLARSRMPTASTGTLVSNGDAARRRGPVCARHACEGV